MLERPSVQRSDLGEDYLMHIPGVRVKTKLKGYLCGAATLGGSVVSPVLPAECCGEVCGQTVGSGTNPQVTNHWPIVLRTQVSFRKNILRRDKSHCV